MNVVRKAMPTMRRLRIWEAHGGFCVLCKIKIDGVREKWIVEHVIALGLGGPDTDENCGPAHETCRRAKDKADIPAIAKVKRIRAAHIGARKPRGFPKPPEGYNYWTRRIER